MRNKPFITAVRYHDISCGHRVFGHETKCRYLHGHNYRIHFYATAERLDDIGRVIDFGVIKSKLCMWLEEHYDHKFLIWERDDLLSELQKISPESVVAVPYNPTAENIADYLLREVAPKLMEGTGVVIYKVLVEETAKCRASAQI